MNTKINLLTPMKLHKITSPNGQENNIQQNNQSSVPKYMIKILRPRPCYGPTDFSSILTILRKIKPLIILQDFTNNLNMIKNKETWHKVCYL